MDKPETLAVHAGKKPDPGTGSLIPPLYQTASYRLPEFGPELLDALFMESDAPPHAYSRWSNPTVRALEEKLAALEGAPAALVTATGMAAVSALALTFLQAGDHLVASESCYAGSVELFGQYLPRYGIQVALVDTGDPDQVCGAIRPETRLIYAETPANPLLRLSDIGALATIAREAGALLAVDSTFAGPLLQRPLELGADYVVHSLTKYLNGHGDTLGGVILGPAEGLKRVRKEMLVHLGGAASPFNAWLIWRGLVTLPLRMDRHCQNALAVARYLEGCPAVERVIYPGLESHPQRSLAQRQMSAGGGMVSVQLKEGLSAALRFAEKARLFTYATSLGHPHSLFFYYPTDLYVDDAPYLHEGQKRALRRWMGEGLLRLSIGLEHIDDLLDDLAQAL